MGILHRQLDHPLRLGARPLVPRPRALLNHLFKRHNDSVIARSGLSTGEIYLGSVGHPDYARPDIMGDVVNIAFLTLAWVDRKNRTGLAATAEFVQALPDVARKRLAVKKQEKTRFLGVAEQVCVQELELIEARL